MGTSNVRKHRFTFKTPKKRDRDLSKKDTFLMECKFFFFEKFFSLKQRYLGGKIERKKFEESTNIEDKVFGLEQKVQSEKF